MIDTDPPRHTDLRGLVAPPFLAGATRGYENLVQAIARDVVSEATGVERFDLVEQIAVAVPIKVLCRLLGVPESDEALLVRLGDQMIANTDPDLTALLLDGGASDAFRLFPFRSPAALEMFDYSRRLAQAAPSEPSRRSGLSSRARRDRRPLTRAAGDRRHVPSPGGGGERNHAPSHRPECPGPAPTSRPDGSP